MTDLMAILLGVVLVNEFVLGRFPGLFALPPSDGAPLAVAASSLATIVTVAIASPAAWLLDTRVLAAIGVPQLSLFGWAIAVAITVRGLLLLARQGVPVWHGVLHPFRPLVTFNATAIGIGLAATGAAVGPVNAALRGAAVAALFCALLVLFTGIRRRLESGDVPGRLRGTAIGLVTAAIISLAFTGLEGVWRG